MSRRPTIRITPRNAAHEALANILDDLETDEIRVLTRLAERLRTGMRVYGVLNLARDQRDFREVEARQEVEDLLVYLACAWLTKGGAS